MGISEHCTYHAAPVIVYAAPVIVHAAPVIYMYSTRCTCDSSNIDPVLQQKQSSYYHEDCMGNDSSTTLKLTGATVKVIPACCVYTEMWDAQFPGR